MGIRLTKSERKILVGRFLTRAGDQAWDFVLPLTLASVFPERIALIALFYLLSKVGTVFLQPWALGIINKWNRLSAARCGLLVQAFSVILICLCLWIFQTGNEQFDAHASGQLVEDHQLRFYLFGACMVLGSVASTLGSGLLEVAVGNDWLPVIAARERLVHVNSCLKQVDLFTGGGFIKALIAGWSEFVKHPAALSMTAFALVVGLESARCPADEFS